MGGFGRKGLEGLPIQGTAYQQSRPVQAGLDGLRNTARGQLQVQPRDSQMSRKLEAFVAAERAQRSHSSLPAAAAGHRNIDKPERSLALAYLLWFVLGQISAHRFYLGAYRSAFAQLGLFAFWLFLALGTPEGSFSTAPVVAMALIGWALWVLGDVFFIHRIHRKLSRRPGEAAAAFA